MNECGDAAMSECGTDASYRLGCRRDACRIPWNAKQKAGRWARAALRTLDADGRLKAPLPPEKHGRVSTYNGWMCRCRACTDDSALHKRLRKVESVNAEPSEFCDVHGEVAEDHDCGAA